jgi:hypothetical protein
MMDPDRADALDDLVAMMRAAAIYTARAGRRSADAAIDAAASMDAAETRRLRLARVSTAEIVRRLEGAR